MRSKNSFKVLFAKAWCFTSFGRHIYWTTCVRTSINSINSINSDEVVVAGCYVFAARHDLELLIKAMMLMLMLMAYLQ